MSLLRFVVDWAFIACSTWIFGRAVNRLVMQRYASVGNYVQVVLWAFCCLPIALDFLVGQPQYLTVYWYIPFIEPMSSNEVSVFYDALLLASMAVLDVYCRYAQGKQVFQEKRWNTVLGASKVISAIAIVLPFVYVVVSGLASYYLAYGDPQTRGMPSGSGSMVTWLLLISCIAFSQWFFAKQRIVFTDWLVLATYFVVAAWLSGKRFMIALLLVVMLFFYLRRDLAARKRRLLTTLLPFIAVALVGFSAFYLVGVRPLSDTGFDSVYEMLRVDFGRDDVTKYSLYHELFLDDHILEYPGETFASTFLVLVPRELWPAKPFMHYQYLTSSILSLPISQLPAGTTPSWFDMCICNFGVLGCVVSVFGLLALVYLADRMRSTTAKAVCLLLVFALLTQSIDAYISLAVLLPVLIIAGMDSGVVVRRRSVHLVATRSGRYRRVENADS